MAEKSMKPAIRFAGFNDFWEQRNLGDIADVKTGPFGSSLHASDYVDEGIPIITTEHFKTGKLPEMGNGIPQVSDFDYDRLKSYILRTGDIVFSRVGSVDINALVAPNNNGWLFSGRVLRVRPEDCVDSCFLHYILETPPIRANIVARAVGQTMPSINTEILRITDLAMPECTTEQQKIGAALQHFDHLITLHRSKHDKLVNIKTAMLGKMFPQDGSSVPEVRFAGFTGAWEQCKLGEVVQIKDSARIPNKLWLEFGVRYLRSSDLESSVLEGNLFISPHTYEAYKAKTGAPELGDVMFNSGGNIGLAHHKTDNSPVYVQGGAILYARTSQSKNVDGSYLSMYFATPKFRKYVELASAGGTIKHFTLKPANDTPFIFPNIEEQKQIGQYFRPLDRLITLHQRELEKLQNLKRAFLERMFV